MKLEFDSVEELGHFLHWAVNELTPRMLVKPTDGALHVGGGSRMVPITVGAGGSGTAFGDLETPPGTHTQVRVDFGVPDRVGVWPDGTPHEFVGVVEVTPDTKPADSPEPAKRKRRTKAEIEADEKAAAEIAADAIAEQAAAAQPEGAQGANPFDQPSTLQDVAAEGTETLNGDKKPEPTDEDGGESVVTPFQHLTRAREFIAKHGMPKYNESFTKAGLDANVMAYSAFQRALHITALDELEKAGS